MTAGRSAVHRGTAGLLPTALLLLLLSPAGCASAVPRTPPPTAPSTPSSTGGRGITLDEHASGGTVTLPVGATLQLTLHSTYWRPPTSSAVTVLGPIGSDNTSTAPTGSGCHPGSGCGTISARFTALRSGTVTVSSSRTSCGEAMACTPAQRTFTVTVRITAQ